MNAIKIFEAYSTTDLEEEVNEFLTKLHKEKKALYSISFSATPVGREITASKTVLIHHEAFKKEN